jgi:hypothetical protein
VNVPNFTGKIEDYIWYPVEKTPGAIAPTEAEPPAKPLPTMKISPTPIGADEMLANLDSYISELTRRPNWQAELEEKNKAAKLARREARKLKRKAA